MKCFQLLMKGVSAKVVGKCNFINNIQLNWMSQMAFLNKFT